ncbi:MAG: tripartite tricarboxylate transporter TctB family protein [Acetobacterales bacterium]
MLAHHDRMAGAAIFVLSVAAFAWTYTFPDSAAAYARMITGSMVVLSAVMFGRSFTAAERDKVFEPLMRHPRRFAVGAAMTVAYCVGCEYVGYYTASLVFIPTAAWVFGLRRPVMIAVTTVAYCAMIYGIFEVLFERPLPPEVWMAWFGE